MKALDNLKRSLAWRIFPWAGLELAIGPGCTVVLRNRGDFLILREIFIAREYDRFLEQAGPITTWLDLGCNCGMFSLRLEMMAQTNQWPEPRRAALVDANAEALSAARAAIQISRPRTAMDVVLAAVGPKGQQTIEFFEGKTSHKSRLTSLGSRGRRVTRPVADLEAITAKVGPGPLDLVKVDIEGAEAVLLEHWAPWLADHAKHVLIEWHEPEMPGKHLRERMDLLDFQLMDAASEAGAGGQALRGPIGTALFRRKQ